MNVWTIDKTLTIKHFLFELVHSYGENRFSFNEDIDQQQAIEIYLNDCPELAAYIYTFAQAHERYGVDLKYPLTVNNIIGENENLNLDQLISIITTHFDLTL